MPHNLFGTYEHIDWHQKRLLKGKQVGPLESPVNSFRKYFSLEGYEMMSGGHISHSLHTENWYLKEEHLLKGFQDVYKDMDLSLV